MIELLYQDDYATLTREPGFIRVRRTSTPSPTGEQAKQNVDAQVDRFRMMVPLRERKGLGVLLDTREAPMNPDDEKTEVQRPLMMEVLTGFSRSALLVKTAVGKLQATRRSREESARGRELVPVFDDESAAIAFVRGEEPSAPSPRSSRRSP